MSAIFGILRFDDGEVSARDLERMSNVLVHRGPDGRKSVVDGAIGLGHCLMRVNQEDLFERQPLADRDADVTLVADCRIDNREELAGIFGIGVADLRTMPDSAFVLHAYKKWGEDCAAHLLGDFAYAIWDRRARKLVLGRDHMGQRSVHYYRGKDFFAFATEIKALWALEGVPRKISEAQIGKFLLLDVRSREGASYFEEIWGVQGGTTVTIDARCRQSVRRYWEAHAAPEHLHRDEAYYLETYRRISGEAVECRIRRLIAPPSLSLSGGFDSAAIAALCGPVLTAQGRKLIAVSAVPPTGDRGARAHQRHWVEMCDRHMPHLDVRYLERSGFDVLTNLEKQFMAADGLVHPLHYRTDQLLREASGAGAHLIMNGIGGDETINRRSYRMLALWLRNGEFGKFLSEFDPHRRMTGRTFLRTLRSEVIHPFLPTWVRQFMAAARRRFIPRWSTVPLTRQFASKLLRSGAADKDWIMAAWFEREKVRTSVLQTLSTWPSASRRWDANEAARYGMDLTAPFMDMRVVEFGMAIPRTLDERSGRERDLACRALGDLYPPEFHTRGRSRDSLEPDMTGMIEACRSALHAEIERLRLRPALAGLFDFDKMARQLAQSIASKKELERAAFALRAFLTAEYVAWFDGGNQ